MPDAAQLAQAHWNDTPLFITEQERYSTYPWLYEVAEFRKHGGEKVLEIGCGTGSDLLQFAKHGALATGVDVTAKHVELLTVLAISQSSMRLTRAIFLLRLKASSMFIRMEFYITPMSRSR